MCTNTFESDCAIAGAYRSGPNVVEQWPRVAAGAARVRDPSLGYGAERLRRTGGGSLEGGLAPAAWVNAYGVEPLAQPGWQRSFLSTPVISRDLPARFGEEPAARSLKSEVRSLERASASARPVDRRAQRTCNV